MPSIFTTAPKFFDLFKEGKELANAATWKNRTILVNVLTSLLVTLVALAKVYGYDFKMGDQTLQQIATALVVIFGAGNAVMHTITSARVGVQANGGSEAPAGTTDDSNKSSEG
jgi:hypothetical protein